jgi:hypothetical protein
MNRDMTFPEGTTKEQWDKYYTDLAAHEDYCEKIKPKKSDYGYINNMPPDEDVERAYESALSEWHMRLHCDAPNKPGYYRANND